MVSLFYLLRLRRLSRNNSLQVLSRSLSLFAGVLLLNFSFVRLLAQGTSSKPSSIVLPVHTTFLPETVSNRRMDYLSDATAVGWNPSLLGMRSHFDMTIAGAFSSNGIQTTAKYGVFAKAYGFGIGYAANPSFKPSSGELYLGYGFQALDDILWGGVSVRQSFFSLSATDFNVSLTTKPLAGLFLSASATTMGMESYQEYAVVPQTGKPPVVSYNIAATYSLTSDLTFLAFFRSRSLEQPENISIDAGVSYSFLDALVVLSGNLRLTQPVFRFGVEVNSAIFDLGYNGRLAEGTAFENTIFFRFSNDKAHAAGQLLGKRVDADLCFGMLNPALENPVGFLSTLPRLNPLLAETFADNGFARDSSALYTTLRKQFYARQQGKNTLHQDVFVVAKNDAYRVEFKKNSYARFPLVSTIVRVSDSLGRSVEGLSVADFVLKDMALSAMPRRIVSVQRLDTTVSVPVDVVMLIDCSGSMHDKIQETREKAEQFMTELGKSGIDARIGGILYGTDIIDVLQPTSDYGRFDEFLARANASQSDEYTPNALDELMGMKFRPDAERIGIVISDEVMYSNRNPALREVLTIRALWEKRISIMKIVKPCENNGAATAYLTLGREYDIAQPFNDVLSRIGRESAALYIVTTEPTSPTNTVFVVNVRDERGNPVMATITLTDADNAVIGPFRTNELGVAEQAIIEGKKYQMFVQPTTTTIASAVSTTANGVLSDRASAGIIVRTLDATRLSKGGTLRQDILLLPRTVLRGVVRNELGKPLAADVFLKDNLGYELPISSTSRTAGGLSGGDFEAAIVAGRKYTVTIVPVASVLYEPLERVVDARALRAGDTVEQTFTLQRITPFVQIEGVVHYDSASSDAPGGGVRITVKNQANQEIIARTESRSDGAYSFRLPKGTSAEVVLEGGGYTPERWRAFFRKTDTVVVAKVVTVLQRKPKDADEEEQQARSSLILALRGSSALTSQGSVSGVTKPAWVTSNDTANVALEAPSVNIAPPVRELRMPESRVLALSFADAKEVKPIAMDTNGALIKRSWEEELERVAKEITADSAKLAKVVVIGHADETASMDANRAEGWQRADFVVKELVRRGVPESLITATSQGNSQLLQRRPKESALAFRARCRRVELMKIWR